MKLSPAQAALLHTLESAASSAILTFIVGLVQYLSTHALSWPDLATVFASGFVAAFGLIYKSVITSPNLQQAEADTLNQAIAEAKSLAQNAMEHIDSMWPAIHNLTTQQAAQKAPVTVQPIAGSTATIPQPSMVVQPSSVPQVAFPTAGPVPAAATYAPAYMPPVRSFTQSALMPTVTPTKQ